MFKLDILNKALSKLMENFLDRVLRVEGFVFSEEVGLACVFI